MAWSIQKGLHQVAAARGWRLLLALSAATMVPDDILGQEAHQDPVRDPGDVILQQESLGVLQGRVLSSRDRRGIEDARVVIAWAEEEVDASAPAAEPVELFSGADGSFEVGLPSGRYRVVVEAFGFLPHRRVGIRVSGSEVTRITVHLRPAPFPLEEIVVAPSRYGLFGALGDGGRTVTQEEVERMPHFGNDAFRVAERLPGVSTFDATAKLMVRGAPSGETLTILDGLELFEPYHLKNWDGSLSIIDEESIGDLSLMTGGFSAEYGDKSAGVLLLRSAEPSAEGLNTTLGLSFMNATVKSEGRFAGGRGAWLASARRGYLDLVMDITNRDQDPDEPEDEFAPVYYDAFAKVSYELLPGHRVTGSFLHAGDEFEGREEEGSRFHHRYGNSYAWLTWDALLSERLSGKAILSYSLVSRDRGGADFDDYTGETTLEVRDQATMGLVGLKQDWRLSVTENWILKGGLDLRWGAAEYDYFRWRKVWTPNSTDPADPPWAPSWDIYQADAYTSGTEVGAYLATRLQPAEGITTEVGLRFHRHPVLEEVRVGPRVSAAYNPTESTIIRAAWGHYHQSHGLHELWIGDDDERFFPSQRAEHRVLGVEQRLGWGMALRVEGYQRLVADPLPEYRELVTKVDESVRELEMEDRRFVAPDRVEARGVELLLTKEAGQRFAWSASYALAEAVEKVEGAWNPRPFDQTHTLALQTAIRPSPSWSIGASWSFHSAWPCTLEHFTTERDVTGAFYAVRHFGPMNSDRLFPYHRLDLRISRTFDLARGQLTAFLDFFNFFDRQNPQNAVFYANLDPARGEYVTMRTFDDQIEMLPTFGLKWVF